jgi:hypothetical protein
MLSRLLKRDLHSLRPLEFSILKVFCACAIAAIAWSAVYAQTSDEPPEVVSRVLLTNTFVDLNVDSLRQRLEELYPGQFMPPHIKGSFVVKGRTLGQFVIQSNVAGASGVFLLNSASRPYRDFSTFTDAIADGPLRRKVEAQCCWLSVDLAFDIPNKAAAYRFIEQVLAKLAPPDAAFLVDPQKHITVVFDDELRRRFAGGEIILSSP